MSDFEERDTEPDRYETAVRTVPNLDAEIRAWALDEVRKGDLTGAYWYSSEPDKRLLKEHLRTCSSAIVQATEWLPAMGYCHTCYESAHLQVTVACDHGQKADVEIGYFGDLPELLKRFEAWMATTPAD